MTQGVYALIIENTKNLDMAVGKLGSLWFPKGFYVYIGSALGKTSTNLEHRLKRHLSPTKTLFWHIDYLLNSEFTTIIAIITAQTSEKKECRVVSELKRSDHLTCNVPKFGSSDCVSNCGSHLLYSTLDPTMLNQEVQKAFSNANLSPSIMNF
ncbi:MAG: GIY-YIG nuclease family protein [Candidatus Helarchaeota archaeon]